MLTVHNPTADQLAAALSSDDYRARPVQLEEVELDGRGPCWLVASHRVPRLGYLALGRDRGHVLAHRLAYELAVGPVPDGLTIDHLCHGPDCQHRIPGGVHGACLHRRCVRPDHLEPVTVRENILRGSATGACHARSTRCPAGHELVGSNLEPSGLRRGTRRCVACGRLWRLAVRSARARLGITWTQLEELPRDVRLAAVRVELEALRAAELAL